MNPNNRITYRFDQKGKQVEKNAEIVKVIPEKLSRQAPINNVVPLYSVNSTNVINEIHPWDNSLQEELGALEQLIRESGQRNAEYIDSSVSNERKLKNTDADKKTASKKEHRDVSNESWVEESQYVNHSKAFTSRDLPRQQLFDDEEIIVRKSNGPSWFNVFLSVAGALATGALFGYLILSLFVGGDMWLFSNKTDVSTSVTGSKDQNVSVDEIVALPLSSESGEKSGQLVNPERSVESTAVSSISLGGERYSYTLLQYGVFSHSAGRDEAIKQLEAKELASASTQTGVKFPVYAGIATDTVQTGALVKLLPGLEVYKKEVIVQIPDKLVFNGSKEEASRYFERTNELLSSWTSLIVTQMEQPSLSALEKAASTAWQEKFKLWKESSLAMKEGMENEKGKVFLNRLNQAIEKTAALMLDYDKQPKITYLWSAQSELMNAVLSQKEWFESMSAL
ncbi:hypothetical protein [Paenibacillus sp. L3-i20]|uniref:hypothetical protein n=1 Tax=Paenibacillus sp. L3-i20 TaxID=2905833 RepID=UPI001EDFF9F4|nr:hypothetical protein [Paenibacillus sp. L3-i20]GKU75725.1 hypothetical protein L3i20_v201220 [Paenibacillus sp. L3-i20]